MKYLFKCSEHGVFEVEQRMHETHEATCPVCGCEASRVYVPIPHKWYDGMEPENDDNRIMGV